MITELKNYAKWDEQSHQLFMRELDREGLKERELITINIEGMS